MLRSDRGRRVRSGVGVGPWPDWPDARYDPELLAEGDRRNVVDRYRYWRHEAVVADLDARRHDFHVADRELAARPEHRHRRPHRQRVPRAARCTSSGGGGGTGAARWSPTGTSTCATTDVEDLVGVGGGRRTGVVGVDNLPGAVPIETVAAAPAVRAAVRPGGAGAVRGGAGGAPRWSAPSPSTGRPGRSTPGWPAGSPCTPGSGSTPPPAAVNRDWRSAIGTVSSRPDAARRCAAVVRRRRT